MEKFAFDYNFVENVLNKPKTYKLSEVHDKIKKVAFDVVRFIDSQNIDDLWQIKKGEDGEEYIVAMYSDSDAAIKEKKASNWTAIPDVKAGTISIIYKDSPVKKYATRTLSIQPGVEEEYCNYISTKLAESKKLVSSLLDDLSESEKQNLVKMYPELG